MSMRALFVAAGLLTTSLGPASADSVTATVTAWDAASRTITLQDQSQFADIPATVAVPPGLKAGDEVRVDFEGSENGIEAINGVQLILDVAKRQLPPPADKRG
jgi:hypothetical protein